VPTLVPAPTRITAAGNKPKLIEVARRSAAAELVSPSAEHLRHRLLALGQRVAAVQERRLAGFAHRLGAVARHLRLLHPAAALERRGQTLDDLERRLLAAMAGRIAGARRRLGPAVGALAANSPGRGLPALRLLVQSMQRRLIQAGARAAELRRERLALAVQGLGARSPLATLARGYAMVTRQADGRILRHAADVRVGDKVSAPLARGTLSCVVEEVRGPA